MASGGESPSFQDSIFAVFHGCVAAALGARTAALREAQNVQNEPNFRPSWAENADLPGGTKPISRSEMRGRFTDLRRWRGVSVGVGVGLVVGRIGLQAVDGILGDLGDQRGGVAAGIELET